MYKTKIKPYPGLRLHKAKHTMTGIYAKSIEFTKTSVIALNRILDQAEGSLQPQITIHIYMEDKI